MDIKNDLESLRGLAARESQPAPQVSTCPPIWPSLIAQTEPGAALIEKNGDGRVLRGLAERMRARMERGLANYGMPLRAHNGREALADCQEEVLDALAYAEQARQEGRADHALVNELFALAYKLEKMRMEAADK